MEKIEEIEEIFELLKQQNEELKQIRRYLGFDKNRLKNIPKRTIKNSPLFEEYSQIKDIFETSIVCTKTQDLIDESIEIYGEYLPSMKPHIFGKIFKHFFPGSNGHVFINGKLVRGYKLKVKNLY